MGAALAVTIGSGGILTTSAASSSGERGVFVPIAPCRLFDTRPAPDNVGGRIGALGPGESFVATVRGTNGNCTIPADAIGVSMNVAIIQPSSASFLTVYPSDAARPVAANLNWVAGQAPTPNAVTARLSTDGKVAFYNLAGTVHIAADVNGYYVDHDHDDRYYTKAQLESGPTGIGVPQRMSKRQIALGQWWQDPGRDMAVDIGNPISDIEFDGSNVWVSTVGTIHRFDPRTGVDTQITAIELLAPVALAFDGASMWAANLNSTLSRLDLSGALVTTVPLPAGNAPVEVLFDGSKIWVLRAGTPGSVVRLDPSNGAVVGPFPVGNDPTDMEFDGTNIWVANSTSNTLTKVNTSTLAITNPASSLNGPPAGLAFDGRYLWVAQNAPATAIRAIDTATNTYVGPAIAFAHVNGDLMFDGSSLWAATSTGMYEVERHTWTASTALIPFNGAYTKLVFDGSSIWAGDANGIVLKFAR